MISGLLWLGEFGLEVSGAVLSFRRRLNLLAILLGARAAMDVLTFFLHGDAYGYALWAGQAGQYLLMIALASQLVSSWIRETGTAKLIIWASMIGSLLTIKAFSLADTWPHRFMDAEIAASMSAGVVVCLGWLTRKKPLEGPWNLIATGLIISLSGNAICAIFSEFWISAMSLYPIPALAALLMWNIAAWKPRIKLSEYSRELPQRFVSEEPPKFAPESVRVVRQISERVN